MENISLKKTITSIILILTTFVLISCTKSNNGPESIDKKIDNCIDQKINDGWETSRAETFCDNHN